MERGGALTHRSLRRLLIAVALLVAATGLATTAHVVNASNTSGPAPVPQLLTGIAGTPLTFVVSTKSVNCGGGPCLQLQRTSDSGAHFTTLHLPPISRAKGNPLGNLSQLIFANSTDGYASLNVTNSFAWYVTTDGARSWHRERAIHGETIVQIAPTHHELYAVIAHCVTKYTCTKYRIARSALTAKKWIVEALPAPLSKGAFALAAYDTNIWANFQGPRTPLLFVSHDEGRTFTQSSAALLASVSACYLTPMSPTALWAECPTGMLASFFYSGDAGVHWTSVSRYEYSGTGGGAFDPVSSSLAYLDFGPYTSRAKDLYSITGSSHKMTPTGNIACSSTNGLIFSDAKHGLAICEQNDTNASASTYLIRTSNGGATWIKVSLL